MKDLPQQKVLSIAGDAYEGASRRNAETALWKPAIKSADHDLLPEKGRIDGRVRDLLRNDAYIHGGATLHKDNIVGARFLLNAKPAYKTLGGQFTEAWAEKFQIEVEEKFGLWAESPSNQIDASRMNTFTGLIRLAVGIFVASGELLASVEWLNDSYRPFKTAIKMIDLDRLSTPPSLMSNLLVRGGVEQNKFGAPVAYHIRTTHPSDRSEMVWKRVVARKAWGRQQIIHIVEQSRPDQSRGVSEMVSALKESRVAKQYRDLELQNMVAQATFAATIESELPTDVIFAHLGGGNLTDEEVADAVEGYTAGYFNSVEEYMKSSSAMKIDNVRIPHLLPGSKLNMQRAGQGGSRGLEFEQSVLRYIATALGVSYEQLSKDYTMTNYSSARAAMNETWKGMLSRKRMVADRFASIIYRSWLEEAINAGQIESMPSMPEGWLYEGQNLDALSQCDWIGASRGQIDELKETQAAVQRIRYGLSTWEDELARLGKDWRHVYTQRQREDQMQKQMGLIFADTDKMAQATTGDVREEAGEDNESNNIEDNRRLEKDDK